MGKITLKTAVRRTNVSRLAVKKAVAMALTADNSPSGASPIKGIKKGRSKKVAKRP